MTHAITRTAVAALLAVLAMSSLAAGPAAADGVELGWLRLAPASGGTDIAVQALTEATCPGGKAVVVSITGPGVPTSGDVGFIVGNTALSALEPTTSGQLLVPLSATFANWFARNAPRVVPAGTYTLSLICRDPLRASIAYGAFRANVAIKDGRYQALGDSAQPFNTQPKSTDPLGGVGTLPSAVPSQSAGVAGAPPASGGSSAPPGSSAGSSSTPDPVSATPSGAAVPPSSSNQPSGDAATSPATTAAAEVAAGDGSTSRLVLGLALAILVGTVVAALLSRRRSAADSELPVVWADSKQPSTDRTVDRR